METPMDLLENGDWEAASVDGAGYNKPLLSPDYVVEMPVMLPFFTDNLAQSDYLEGTDGVVITLGELAGDMMTPEVLALYIPEASTVVELQQYGRDIVMELPGNSVQELSEDITKSLRFIRDDSLDGDREDDQKIHKKSIKKTLKFLQEDLDIPVNADFLNRVVERRSLGPVPGCQDMVTKYILMAKPAGTPERSVVTQWIPLMRGALVVECQVPSSDPDWREIHDHEVDEARGESPFVDVMLASAAAFNQGNHYQRGMLTVDSLGRRYVAVRDTAAAPGE